MLKIAKHVFADLIRSRVALGYAALLFVASTAILTLDERPDKALTSLLSIALTVAPLVALVFSAIHFYNQSEFRELLLAQPIGRRAVFFSEWGAMATALGAAFLLGIGLPVAVFAPSEAGFWLVAVGMALTVVFVSLAFLAAVWARDKARGVGAALLIWFFFAILFDGIVLMLLFAFADWPLERAMLPVAALNPIDMGRVMILMKLDAAALMGAAGAVFQKFFGKGAGMAVGWAVLAVWAGWPIWLAARIFERKDL